MASYDLMNKYSRAEKTRCQPHNGIFGIPDDEGSLLQWANLEYIQIKH